MRLCELRDGLVGCERGHCGAPVKGEESLGSVIDMFDDLGDTPQNS
jgi:hypothetical protein